MIVKNQIVNYFVISGKRPRAFRSPITISASTAKELLKKQYGSKIIESGCSILQVCIDIDSGRLYSPNAAEFSTDVFETLLKAAQVKILKDYGSYSNAQIIQGSPYSSIRLRRLSAFKQVLNFLHGEEIPVLEINLDRMPTTRSMLPPDFQKKECLGGYVSKDIHFIDEIDNYGRKRNNPIYLLDVKAPFILINTSPTTQITSSEKEWVVLSGYRDYMAAINLNIDDIANHADLYAIKRHLYLGWTFEEVCSLMLRSVKSFPELLLKSNRLVSSAISLCQEEHKNLMEHPYYITFKIGDDFPINLASVINLNKREIDQNNQIDFLRIVDIDLKTNYVILETTVFISPDICKRILCSKDMPFICRYNPVLSKADIKHGICDKKQFRKIVSFLENDIGKPVQFRNNSSSRGEWAINPMVYNMRRITDYPYATDRILEICKKYDFAFVDIPVVIGPIEQIMGRGSQGGFVDKRSFRRKHKNPIELEGGTYIDAPSILINSVSMPSYASQTETLIHEYRHFIYMEKDPFYRKEYGDLSNKQGDAFLEEWNKYLSDSNERAAHKEEILYALDLGKSIDEIIRDKVGGEITVRNYPIALKFKELVDEAVREE